LHLNIFDQPTRELFLKSANLYQKRDWQTRGIINLWHIAYCNILELDKGEGDRHTGH
jgi:hypothetical protein